MSVQTRRMRLLSPDGEILRIVCELTSRRKPDGTTQEQVFCRLRTASAKWVSVTHMHSDDSFWLTDAKGHMVLARPLTGETLTALPF